MNCPVCGSGAALDRMFGDVPILRCRAGDCGFRFFDLAKWRYPYAERDYYAHQTLAEAVNPDAPWIAARVEAVRSFKSGGRLAELGCGIGETAIALSRAGFSVDGVEESHNAVEFLARRYSQVSWHCAEIAPFLEQNQGVFDVITMFHVLEHIPHPKAMVTLMDRALTRDGLIVVEVPDAGGLRARRAGWEYYLDHHVNYFDARSLAKLFGAFGYRRVFLRRNYDFAFPSGKALKDVVKAALARLRYDSVIRTAWRRVED